MIKYLKGGSWYFPADSVLAIDTATSADDAIIHVKDEDGSTSDGTLTATGTNSAAQGSNYAEALIEEINFGKQVVIDLTSVHYEADGTAFTVAKA
jgi:hypothetical protein